MVSILGILGGGGSAKKQQIKKALRSLHVNKHVVEEKESCTGVSGPEEQLQPRLPRSLREASAKPSCTNPSGSEPSKRTH